MARRKKGTSKRQRKNFYGGERDEFPGFPFNPDYFTKREDIREIFYEWGFDSWRDVFADSYLWHNPGLGDFNYMRTTRFVYVEDALNELSERRMLAFTKIFIDPSDGLWHIYVMYDE